MRSIMSRWGLVAGVVVLILGLVSRFKWWFIGLIAIFIGVTFFRYLKWRSGEA